MRIILKKKAFVILLLFFALSTNEIVSAEKHDQQLSFIPFFSVQEYYDSNIFKVKESKNLPPPLNNKRMDDFVMAYSAGLDINYPFSRQRVALKGERKVAKYTHYRTENYQIDFLSGQADLALGNNLFLSSDNTFSETVVPRIHNRNSSEQDFRKEAGTSVIAGYKAPKWKLSFLCRKKKNRYNQNDTLDGNVEAWGITFQVIPAEKSGFHVNVIRKRFFFFNTPNEFNNEEVDIFWGGLFWLTRKSALKIEGGFRGKTFSVSNDKDYQGLAGTVTFLYHLSRDTNFSTQISRDTKASYLPNITYFISDKMQAEFLWSITARIKSILQAEHRWLKSEGITGTNPLKFQKHFKGDMTLQYSLAGKLNLDFTYEYSDRSSNLEQFKFTSNKYIATLSLMWQ